MWDIKCLASSIHDDNTYMYYLNHVGYKVLGWKVGTVNEQNEYYLNHVGYKAAAEAYYGGSLERYYLNHVGYKG